VGICSNRHSVRGDPRDNFSVNDFWEKEEVHRMTYGEIYAGKVRDAGIFSGTVPLHALFRAVSFVSFLLVVLLVCGKEGISFIEKNLNL